MKWRVHVKQDAMLPKVKSPWTCGDSLVEVVNAPMRLDLVGLDEACCGGSLCMASLLDRVMYDLDLRDKSRFNDDFCVDQLRFFPNGRSMDEMRRRHQEFVLLHGMTNNPLFGVGFDEFVGSHIRELLMSQTFYLWSLLRCGYEVSFEGV